MKIRYLFLLFAFCFNPAWADFSDTLMWIHPQYGDYLDNEPFILDFRGEWPTDCHPGEQKPVITEYTGDSVLIDFETIVEHPVCNDTPTPYRVLVDMSDVVEDVPGVFLHIEVTMRFGGDEFVSVLEKPCLLRCDPPPPPRDIKPEAGLYFSNGLEKQGLLVARQNQRMGVYPLVYDESGSSEWVLGPGGIVEDVFFATLYESTGGQCLGCPPPADPPQMGAVGKISMLMDSEGVIQVKINDGSFEEYKPLDFGYGAFELVAVDESIGKVPDLSGRWAFVKNGPPSVLGNTTPPTSVLPLVFDVKLRSDVEPPLPVITPPPVDNVLYSILNIEGVEITHMRCFYEGQMVCYVGNTENIQIENFDESFVVRMISPERMIMTNSAPVFEGLGSGTGIAVRID